MIETYNEIINKSGPWSAEFGEWERVMMGIITNEECMILDSSSPQVEVMRCNLKNINRDKLRKNAYYLLKRENKNIETWLYEGIGRIDNSYCVFSRPTEQPKWLNIDHHEEEIVPKENVEQLKLF